MQALPLRGGRVGEAMTPVRVECYSGYKRDERPVRFWLDGREYHVDEVLAEWREPEAAYFRVRSGDTVIVLRYDLVLEEWSAETRTRRPASQ